MREIRNKFNCAQRTRVLHNLRKRGKWKPVWLASISDFGNRPKIPQTDSSPRKITRDGIIFPYQQDMVHSARSFATHTCRPGNATLVIFHLERKHLPLHSTYSGSPYGAGNSNSALYIGLTLYQVGGWEGQGRHPVTRQTSDGSGINGEYWLEILEILKRSRAHPDVSRASRDWNLTLPYYPNRTKGTFDEIWNIRVIPSLAPA